MILVCVKEYKRIEEHVLHICSMMRSSPHRAALQFNRTHLGELGITSVDGAVRWAYDVSDIDDVDTDAGVEQYIDKLQGHGMHLNACHYLSCSKS